MALPYDVSRCIGHGLAVCEDCRRREKGHPEFQSYIMPVKPNSKCKYKIEITEI
jgi:hypothetical protein